MKRRILPVLLAALILCGCGAKPVTPTTAATTQATTAAPETTVPETTTPETTVPETEAEKPDPLEEFLGNMTLREKIGQLFIVAPEQLGSGWCITSMQDTLAEGLQTYQVGGIIYFSDNIDSREQITEFLQKTNAASPIPLFQCVDEEGGMVSRIGNISAMGTTQFPNMMQIGDTGDAAEAYYVGFTIGSEIQKLGFNVDFAPVADVMTNPNNTIIGTRAFSTDPEIAAQMVSAAVSGFHGSGILCSLKHFPGHGNTATDSHYGFASTDRTLSELMECEFLPFVAGMQAGAPMVMVGHICVPSITGDNTPATLSHDIITGVLREELGFTGLCVTDSLQMGAITNFYTSAEAAVAAINAGIDLLLMPGNFEDAYNGLLEAVDNGEISEERIDESVLRILRCKVEYGIFTLPEEP